MQNHTVFALVLAVATAALSYGLALLTERDATRAYRTFFKTLASGLLAGGVLVWLAAPRPEAVATVPFDAAF